MQNKCFIDIPIYAAQYNPIYSFARKIQHAHNDIWCPNARVTQHISAISCTVQSSLFLEVKIKCNIVYCAIIIVFGR